MYFPVVEDIAPAPKACFQSPRPCRSFYSLNGVKLPRIYLKMLQRGKVTYLLSYFNLYCKGSQEYLLPEGRLAAD